MVISKVLILNGASNLLKVAGPVCFLSMQTASVKTALDIIKAKSVGNLPFLPFASLFTNCIIWSFYGWLKKDRTVLVPNALGVLSGIFCSTAYRQYSTKGDLSVLLGAFAVSVFALSLFLSGNASLLGLIGCALAVILVGSPLSTVATVIRDKSTNSMPFLTSFTAWANALSWMLYGILLAKDPMIYGPNGVGFLLASIQLALYAIFGLPTTSKTRATKSEFF